MYAQTFVVEVVIGQGESAERRLCPLEWLDSFCMRNFTGAAEFDDTLPLADGRVEAGFRVSPERLAEAMGDWFTRRGLAHRLGDGGRDVRVEIRPEPRG